ncbi:MAG: beta-mannanase, partial [Ruminiclostridium sp.]|nr:beta-mannanase [Ruminiclostridium sp.]
MTKTNRLTSIVSLLAVCTLTLSGCGGNEPAQTTAAASETQVTQTTEAEPPAPRSNPVAMTADGDVDMEVALAYQTDFDALLKQLDAKVVADDHPVSENTDPETLELYRWLKSIYGKQVIAGQQLGNEHDKESLAYYYYTGDLPAIKGFDFIFKTTKFGDSSDWTQMAIDWHTKSGGIVCFCWHWNVPRDINDTESGATSFYVPGAQNGDPGTTFDIAKAVTPGTKEYERAVHDIDLIAYELQR